MILFFAISFLEANFLNGISSLGSFDAIFCRNVLIYFDKDLIDKILADFQVMLKPSGYLVLGSAESFADKAFERTLFDKTYYYRHRS